MEPTGPIRYDIREFVNNKIIGRKQWIVFLICFAATAIEGFDTIVIGFIAPAISQEWQLSRAALAPLIALGLSGLLIGSILGGTTADRFGRRPVGIAAIAWFGIAGLASSGAHSITQLIFWRFMTGVGIGAALPATSALVAEYSPDRSRSAMIASTNCGFLLGAAVAGFATSLGIGALGWRGMLVVSGVMPLLVTVLLVWQVPESPLYLVAKNRPDADLRSVLGKIFPAVDVTLLKFVIAPPSQGSRRGALSLLQKEYRLGTVLTWSAEFSGYLVFFLIGSWLPTHLEQLGLATQEASAISSMFQFGALAGAVCFAILVRRYNIASVVSGAFAAGSVLVIAQGVSETAPWHAGVVFLAGLAVGGPLICINTIPGIFYPTAFRASGAGWNVAVGRIGSITGSALIGLIVISGFPYLSVCALLSIPLLLACLCMFLMARILSAQNRLLRESEGNIGPVAKGDPSLPTSTTH